MEQDIIKDVKYDIIKTELKQSYNLSYGSLKFYESVVVKIFLDNGVILFGEVTPLKGYTDETIESIEKELNETIPVMLNKSVKDAIIFLEQKISKNNSFVFSSLSPPLEVYDKKLKLDEVKIKDLIYSFDGADKNKDQVQKEFEDIINKGFNTVKIKIGKNFEKDISLINDLSMINLRDIRIRFDANCGYDFNQTKIILKLLSDKLKNNTEYLEQPLGRSAWADMKKICSLKFAVSIMIDESIYTFNEIEKAKETGAKFIKLKLCKFGSLNNLQKALDLSKKLGLNVVFGNGVATDISNYYELIFYYKNKDKIFSATESVGFLKLKNNVKYDIKVEK